MVGRRTANSTVLGSFKLMKGKSSRKHSMYEKKAPSVLLKPFISGSPKERNEYFVSLMILDS